MMHIRIPGTIPPTKSLPMDTPPMKPKRIRPMPGGMVAVMRELYAVTAAGIVSRVYEKRSKGIIENAKRYIEANYQSQISYRDVAREVFISPSYFLTLFKRETGITFVDYLTVVRIEKAKHQLLTTDLSVTQIAFDHGFNNSNYFSNIFRKIVGVSATEFRKPRAGQ
jgi:two-component system response regulator YesN